MQDRQSCKYSNKRIKNKGFREGDIGDMIADELWWLVDPVTNDLKFRDGVPLACHGNHRIGLDVAKLTACLGYSIHRCLGYSGYFLRCCSTSLCEDCPLVENNIK
ncbi:hypothetical protein GUJ93_ZPchr0012g21012 [Zizania palustris]|uniref:Uncharacterized protein n=1 Tax=Zizania palustris TaxID=103762 RepID=A0A8J5WP73_ZIZPA|nr:hypothetical protein GUJ93_ZPchr0012g21012 [Zizania palustris]